MKFNIKKCNGAGVVASLLLLLRLHASYPQTCAHMYVCVCPGICLLYAPKRVRIKSCRLTSGSAPVRVHMRRATSRLHFLLVLAMSF